MIKQSSNYLYKNNAHLSLGLVQIYTCYFHAEVCVCAFLCSNITTGRKITEIHIFVWTTVKLPNNKWSYVKLIAEVIRCRQKPLKSTLLFLAKMKQFLAKWTERKQKKYFVHTNVKVDQATFEWGGHRRLLEVKLVWGHYNIYCSQTIILLEVNLFKKVTWISSRRGIENVTCPFKETNEKEVREK